jgi:hypothetical protein
MVCDLCINKKNSLCQACNALSPIDKYDNLLKKFIEAHKSSFPEITKFNSWYHGKGKKYQIFKASNILLQWFL